MFKEDKFFTNWKYWWSYSPEEEFYIRLKDNPVWPFKQIGEGYYQLAYRSDRVEFGVGALSLFTVLFVLILILVGPFELCFAFVIVFVGMSWWALHGQLAYRELIVCKRGKGTYMQRMFQNEEILFKNEIRNVYVRLTRKLDSQSDAHFYLVVGGYGLDDIRITRMTREERPMKIMGSRLAYRIGINFFDWKDESEEHLVWHYKTHSRLVKKVQTLTETEVIYKKSRGAYTPSPRDSPPVTATLDVPRVKTNSLDDEDETEDSGTRRKVRIKQSVDIM